MNIYTIFLFLLQGFNRLVAIALLFMAEEDAFWCLVYIIEQLMPSEYYSRDKQLIGAQVDQVSMNLKYNRYCSAKVILNILQYLFNDCQF